MKIVCIVFWMALSASVALADLTVVQKLESSAIPGASGNGSTITMKMKGQKARIDFSSTPISSIIDLKSKKLVILDHKQKQVMIMPLDLMQGMLDMPAPGAGQDKAAMQKTGKVQAINGYTCEEYAGSSGGTKIRCWMARTAEASEMEPFQAYAQDAFKATSYGGLAAMRGLIVRSESTVMTNAKPETSRTELKSLSKAPIADAVFDLPPDYSMMGLPSLPTP